MILSLKALNAISIFASPQLAIACLSKFTLYGDHVQLVNNQSNALHGFAFYDATKYTSPLENRPSREYFYADCFEGDCHGR